MLRSAFGRLAWAVAPHVLLASFVTLAPVLAQAQNSGVSPTPLAEKSATVPGANMPPAEPQAASMHSGMPMMPYERHHEAHIKGVIEGVSVTPDSNVHLQLKSDRGPIDIVAAPARYLKSMDIRFAAGDAIEVIGCKHKTEAGLIVQAREITRNGDTMLMRDDKGKPVWEGWIQ